MSVLRVTRERRADGEREISRQHRPDTDWADRVIDKLRPHRHDKRK